MDWNLRMKGSQWKGSTWQEKRACYTRDQPYALCTSLTRSAKTIWLNLLSSATIAHHFRIRYDKLFKSIVTKSRRCAVGSFINKPAGGIEANYDDMQRIQARSQKAQSIAVSPYSHLPCLFLLNVSHQIRKLEAELAPACRQARLYRRRDDQ